jgi:hypothetical protein
MTDRSQLADQDLAELRLLAGARPDLAAAALAALDALALAFADVAANERRQRVLRDRLGSTYRRRGAAPEELLIECLHGRLFRVLGGAVPFVSPAGVATAAAALLAAEIVE